MKVLKYILSLLLLVLVAVPSFAQKSFSVNVWDKKAPEKKNHWHAGYWKKVKDGWRWESGYWE